MKRKHSTISPIKYLSASSSSGFMKYAKKPNNLILLLFIFWLAFPAHAQSQQSQFSDTLLVGCEYDYPPYCYENEEGKADGFSVELFREAAKQMGFTVKFITGSWNKLKSDLAAQKLDALPLVGRTPEREKLFDFTISYLTMHGAIVVRNNNDSIHKLEDLKHKKIAVLNGDNAEEFLRRNQFDKEIIPTTTFKQALIELSKGKHDAVVIQRLLALQLMKENNLHNLKIVGDPRGLFNQSFCFAVPEGDENLQSHLNEGLAILNANGTYRKIHTKWFAPLELTIKRKEPIVVGGDFNFPPFEFLDKNGQPAGFNVDLMKAIADETGMNIEIKLGPWGNVIRQLEKGQINAIQGILYSTGRDEIFDMTPAHTRISYVIASGKNWKIPENLTELKGKKVLVQNRDLLHEYALKRGLEKELVPVDSQEEALRLLSEGEYDYALVPRLLFHYYNEKNQWKNLISGKNAIYSADYGVGVLEGNTALLSKFNEGLKVIKAKGKYREIYSKWLKIYEEPEFTFKDFFKYASFILVPLLLLLIVSIAWSRTLKKRVDKRTRELRDEIKAREQTEKLLTESKENLLFLFENMTQGVVYHKPSGEIVDANEAASRILGLSRDQLYGKSSLDPRWKSIHEDGTDYPGETHPSMITIKTKKPVRDSIMGVFIPEKNSYSWININSVPKFNHKNELIQIVVTFEDITEIRNAKEKAKESDRLKSAFLANMSHEIRTPMSGVIGFSERLKKKDLSDQQRDRYIEIIQSSSHSLLTLINDIIDISRIEAGQLTIVKEPCMPGKLLHELKETFNLIKKQKNKQNIEFITQIPAKQEYIEITTDPNRLKQVLINLLGNALKFTDQGTIEYGYKVHENKIRFFVKDEGIGIAQKNLDNIFNRFEQVSISNERIHEGTGLGLSISKGILELMGGEISVNSTEGKGTIFEFYIPYEKSEDESGPTIEEAKMDMEDFKGKTILIAEDDPINLILYQEALKETPATLLIANNGEEAVEIVANNPNIDIILMDIRMPLIDGIEAAQIILKASPKMKIIAQTAYAMANDKSKYLNLGFVDYFPKPIDIAELPKMLSRWF